MESTEKCGFEAAEGCEEVDSLDKLKWWQQASIYQVLIQSFQDTDGDGKGDILGVIERLDYFVALGVDAVWISPIYDSPMADMGYEYVSKLAKASFNAESGATDTILATIARSIRSTGLWRMLNS